MRVHSIKVKNFKVLQNIEMKNIPGFAVLVGANGTGKSTLIDVFDFLKAALKDDVRTALRARGGFGQVVSRGHESEPIEITLQIEMDIAAAEKSSQRSRLVTYHLSIEEVDHRQVSVAIETLRFKRSSFGAPYHFIRFEHGRGEALAESFDAFDREIPLEELTREEQELDAPYILALKGLGQFKRFDAASQLRELIENWEVTDLHIEDARREPDAALAEHLNSDGSNIALYSQYLFEDHPDIFKQLVQDAARYIPGIGKVEAENLSDGRVALRFWDKAFKDGFLARAVSDGTIRMFAYLALLKDPAPHPLLCIEEPENQLYPTLLGVLAEQFSIYARRRIGEGQVFVTSHSPDFLNYVPLEAIYWLKKDAGYSVIERAADDEQLVALVEEGDRPGELWRQNLFTGVAP